MFYFFICILIIPLIIHTNATPPTIHKIWNSKHTNRTEWIKHDLESNLNAILDNKVKPISRDLTNGALAVLLLQNDCTTAIKFLRQFGSRYDMSFGGESIPVIFNEYYRLCFQNNTEDHDFFISAINSSLVQSIPQATSQEKSYTNMYLMASITSYLFGEMAETIPLLISTTRATKAKKIGYLMWNLFYNYTLAADIHEFVSPTYSNVQLSILYIGYIYTKNKIIKQQIESILDYLYLELAANYYEPSAQLSGPHSRDYDFLLSHGMVDLDLYSIAHFRNMQPLTCEINDPHCEGAPLGWNISIGTGEPMTCISLTYLNIIHPRGYKVKHQAIEISQLNNRIVRSKFLGQNVSANGQFGLFSDTYNYIHIDNDNASGFAIGSASQEYITRTHSKYTPYPGSKLVNIVLGSLYSDDDDDNKPTRPIPTISIQTDFMNSPYGIPDAYPKWSHGDKGMHLNLHPGMVQHKNVLLATTAINVLDTPDAFATSPLGEIGSFIYLSTDIILPLHANMYWIVYPNQTSERLMIDTNKSFEIVLPVGSSIGCYINTGGVAVKLFVLDDVDGIAMQTFSLIGDEAGMALGALRVVGRHFVTEQNVSVKLNNSHIRFAALFIAESVTSGNELQVLTEKVNRSNTVSKISMKEDGENIWETFLLKDDHETELLYVSRSLNDDCAVKYNQSLNTSWNCLKSRRIYGQEIVPSKSLEINGELVEHPC